MLRVVTLLCLLRAALADPPPSLISAMSDVGAAEGHVFDVKDSISQSMGVLRVRRTPGNFTFNGSPYSFVGMYHVFSNGTFSVHAALSTDLRGWTHAALLVPNADMPYFEIDAPTGLLLLLHEQWLSPHSNAPCTVRAALYASLSAALAGAPPLSASLAPSALSNLQGTPSITSWSASADSVVVGLHFNEAVAGGGNRDQAAAGALLGLRAGAPLWSMAPWDAYNSALTAAGAVGNIGGRDALPCGAGTLVLQEGNRASPTDWARWAVFVREATDGMAAWAPLAVTTPGGSRSFGNPGVAHLGGGLLAVSYFLFSEGAAPGEAGQLLFWTTVEC